MAKKRGGLAGLYDRNKGVIKALAPIALGAIPGVGVTLAAVAGAAMGADREGKGYFKGLASREGLAGAALGGVSGYAGGKMGKSAASSIKNMLTAQKMKSASALIDQANANIASQGVPGVDMPSFASRDVFAGNLPIGGYSGDAQTYLADVASRGPSAPMPLDGKHLWNGWLCSRWPVRSWRWIPHAGGRIHHGSAPATGRAHFVWRTRWNAVPFSGWNRRVLWHWRSS